MNDKGAITLTPDPSVSGMRLDLYTCTSLPDLSRSQVSDLIKQGQVRVHGETKKPGYHIKNGDVIFVRIPSDIPSEYLPEAINIDIIFEDQYIAVIDKPAGLVVHPGPGHPNGTLVNALLHHCPDIRGIGGEIRPGIVHRLDKDTSGLIVVAKDDKSHRDLALQFKSRQVVKEYLALTYGEWKVQSGRIVLPIGRHPSDRKKMSVHSRKGRAAETQWQVQSNFNGLSLVKADLKTGRTHQIRVHFAAANHPIVGDPVYAGQKAANRLGENLRPIIKQVKRQLLHAWHLRFSHPETKKAMSFTSEMPNDMAQVVTFLSDGSP